MPLISQTAAQHSTFLTHISSFNPSSCASIWDCRENQGCKAGNALIRWGSNTNLPWVNNDTFQLQVLETGTLETGSEGRREREHERMWGLTSGILPGDCMHDKWHANMGDRRQTFLQTHTHKAAEGAVESPVSPVSEVTEPDVVHWCREKQWGIQHSTVVILSESALEWAATFYINIQSGDNLKIRHYKRGLLKMLYRTWFLQNMEKFYLLVHPCSLFFAPLSYWYHPHTLLVMLTSTFLLLLLYKLQVVWYIRWLIKMWKKMLDVV